MKYIEKGDITNLLRVGLFIFGHKKLISHSGTLPLNLQEHILLKEPWMTLYNKTWLGLTEILESSRGTSSYYRNPLRLP